MTFDSPWLTWFGQKHLWLELSGTGTWYVDGRNGFRADGIRGTAGVDESLGTAYGWYGVPRVTRAPGKSPYCHSLIIPTILGKTGQSMTHILPSQVPMSPVISGCLWAGWTRQASCYNNNYYRNNLQADAGYNHR